MSARTLLVVSGGLRSPSSTRLLADQLAAAATAALEGAGEAVTVRHVEVRDHAHAVVDALLTGFPTGDLRTVLADIEAADGLVVVTPTFQATTSGLVTSFLDLFEAGSLRGVPVLLAATGGTERHSLVIEHSLRPMLSYLGAVTVPTGVYAATADFGGEGAPALAGRIERSAGELAGLVAARPSRTVAAPVVVPFAALLAADRSGGRLP